MKREFFALTILFVLFVAFPASLFGYQAWLSNPSDARVIMLTANAPSNGGWVPDTIRVNLGERVRLRIASPDVVHGFEIPALGIQVDEILPGHVAEVEFIASRVGKFPFACTRWCSVDHWRMRGNIEVVDPNNPYPTPQTFAPPLYQQLKIDIDALHPAQNVPPSRPSAARGASLAGLIVISTDLRTQSPSDVFAKLRVDDSPKSYSDQQLWDVIAFAWKQAAGDESIAKGQQLYARDCAACHGELGKGNGPAGRDLPGLAAMQSDTHSMQDGKRGPADFTNTAQMLGASDVLLQGKIVRGGMGTGMPEWRTLYTDEEMWQVISFIRSFTFDYGLTK
ncbi:MAG: cytochrome c oxidase subunit II [Chloroflexi bacterium]|nr:cytochrome c oxidase subunit II [Chloroflexota bacterium]